MNPSLEELIAKHQKNLKEGVAIFLKNGSVGLTDGILSEPMKAAWQAALQTVLAGLPEKAKGSSCFCNACDNKRDNDRTDGFNTCLSEVKDMITKMKV